MATDHHVQGFHVAPPARAPSKRRDVWITAPLSIAVRKPYPESFVFFPSSSGKYCRSRAVPDRRVLFHPLNLNDSLICCVSCRFFCAKPDDSRPTFATENEYAVLWIHPLFACLTSTARLRFCTFGHLCAKPFGLSAHVLPNYRAIC